MPVLMPRSNNRPVGSAKGRVAQWSMFALALWATSSAAGVPPDLTKLQSQVAEWRRHATRDKLDAAAGMESHLADCTDDLIAKAEPGALEFGGAIFQLADDEYNYTTLAVSDDRFCMFMIR